MQEEPTQLHTLQGSPKQSPFSSWTISHFQNVHNHHLVFCQALSAAQRAISTGATLEQAAPALATVTKKTGGFLSSLFGVSSSQKLPPLYEPLSGVPEPPPLDVNAPAPTTKITALDNGMRIASEDMIVSCSAFLSGQLVAAVVQRQCRTTNRRPDSYRLLRPSLGPIEVLARSTRR
jgi:hypothetical protein